jgi:hypothetical protein
VMWSSPSASECDAQNLSIPASEQNWQRVVLAYSDRVRRIEKPEG